jgi:catechol 2,3-dioxygenase
MGIPRVKRVAHVVLYVADPEASARWYSDVLGMTVSARVAEGPYKGGVFMSFGEHDHDLAFFPAPPEDRPARYEHIGLEVDC